MAGNKHRKRAQRKGDIGRFIGSVDVYMILFVDSLEKKSTLFRVLHIELNRKEEI
jgi:hypothetical protein